ncbi:kinase-like domain-containing protein, partial [Chytriomyces sp. MP71]
MLSEQALEKKLANHFTNAIDQTIQQIFLTRAIAQLCRSTQTIPSTSASSTSSNPSLPEWTLTSWEFELGPTISNTPYAEVLEATWLNHTRVTLKRLHLRLDTRKLRAAFLHEVETWFPLRHPHVLPLLGACASSQRPFMVSPHMSRGSALAHLAHVPRTAREAATGKLLYEAALGLQYLHARGVIHGMLRAANVLVDAYGKACVADFGFASLRKHAMATTTMGTGQDLEAGLRWMAPERMMGGKMTPQVDVYAFGMVGLEVLRGGRVPFDALPVEAALYPIIGRNLFNMIQACWDTDPQARPSFSLLSENLK